MFTAHAAEFLVQPVFMLKMGLILAAGVNAAVLHTGLAARGRRVDADAMPPARVRAGGGALDPVVARRDRLRAAARLLVR